MAIDWSETPTHRLIIFIPNDYVQGADKFVQLIDFEGPEEAISNGPGVSSNGKTDTHKVLSSVIPASAVNLFAAAAQVRDQETAAKVWETIKTYSPEFEKLVEAVATHRKKINALIVQAITETIFYIVTNEPNAKLVVSNQGTAASEVGKTWRFSQCLENAGLTRLSVDVDEQEGKKLKP